MQSFSQRKGIRPVKSIMQVESMDDDLRNSLWNALQTFYWNRVHGIYGDDINKYQDIHQFAVQIWREYFKIPIDMLDKRWSVVHGKIRSYFFQGAWYEVYDFIEFVANSYNSRKLNQEFIDYCNRILEREMSAYRFVDGVLVQLTSEEEIGEIEQVLNTPIKPVSTHMKTALSLLSDKVAPDYRNSIKESISAVESLCNLITGGKDTLGDALKKVETRVAIHSALKKGFSCIYGYTNDASGIRHALLDEPTLKFEDAKYMLVSCSAFINYLIAKATEAGITF